MRAVSSKEVGLNPRALGANPRALKRAKEIADAVAEKDTKIAALEAEIERLRLGAASR
jgi:hypothetical protein